MDELQQKTVTGRRGRSFRRGIYLLPNLFTMGAIFAGFYAMVMATKGEYTHAAIAILIAIVLDGLDGRVARMTDSQSEFGAQLDSLSDMVSFGIAPALVMYLWSLNALGKLGWCVAFIFSVCGALRLARFNTQAATSNKRYFFGLAIPLPAGFIASLIWMCQEYQISGPWLPYALAVLAVVLGLLEVSLVRYRSFKDIDMRNKVPFYVILLSVLLLVLIVYNPPVVLSILCFLYALSGPLHWLWLKRRSRKKRKKRVVG